MELRSVGSACAMSVCCEVEFCCRKLNDRNELLEELFFIEVIMPLVLIYVDTICQKNGTEQNLQ